MDGDVGVGDWDAGSVHVRGVSFLISVRSIVSSHMSSHAFGISILPLITLITKHLQLIL